MRDHSWAEGRESPAKYEHDQRAKHGPADGYKDKSKHCKACGTYENLARPELVGDPAKYRGCNGFTKVAHGKERAAAHHRVGNRGFARENEGDCDGEDSINTVALQEEQNVDGLGSSERA